MSDRAVKSTGGTIKAKNVMRKTKNTLKTVSKVAKELQPYAELAMAGAGVGMNSGCSCGGSFKSMGLQEGRGIQSSLVAPSHPSFNPKPPKSIKRRQIEN